MVRLTQFALIVAFVTVFSASGQNRKAENEFYRIVTLPTPAGVVLEAGEMQFLGPDKLACATRQGDIWIADGVMGDPPQPQWKLFASGLHEILGLSFREGWIYATQRGEVTRLKDTKNTGRANVIESFSNDWGIGGDYHEYNFGSKFDKQGNMYLVLCLTGSFSSENPFRGWCLKVGPDGKSTPYASGIRSPGGIGFNAEGDLFYTDNQGPWRGGCLLQQIKFGAFCGHPGGFRWFNDPATKARVEAAGLKQPVTPKSKSRLYDEAKHIPELLPPALYFPYQKMGQSAAGIACDLTGGKFGPFKEQLFVGDQTWSTVMRVYLEKMGDRYQGACFPFREGLDSGSLGLEFASDGSLFVFGTDRGWGARGGKPFALQRLIWNGKVPFEIHEMHAKPDGFELTFTQPVDPQTASAVESYAMNTFIYIYQSDYGSPEVDKTIATIKSATVAANKMSVRLVVDGLVEGHIHELHVKGLRSANGQPLLHDAAYYTLNQIPAK